MEGKRFIKRIKVQNLLSFDEEGIDLELQPLNVLIGPNGSGKSNLIDVIRALRATTGDLPKFFAEEGGVTHWFHSGKKSGTPTGQIQTLLTLDKLPPLSHQFALKLDGQRLRIVSERFDNFDSLDSDDELNDPLSVRLYEYDGNVVQLRNSPRVKQQYNQEILVQRAQQMSFQAISRSAAAVLDDQYSFPEVAAASEAYRSIAMYQRLQIGRKQPASQPQPADLPGHVLYEDGQNLGAVLNEMKRPSGLFDRVTEELRQLYPRVQRIEALPSGGTVQVHLREESAYELVPATRLSDGTIRFLCHLAVLLCPNPPRLVCIEEPELGLHPDMINKVAELLIEASQRMQLIVTTHSDGLVNALTEHVESVVVCEHDGKGTRMMRLEREKLKGWLEDYSLGELWSRGHIGGNRW